MVQRAQVTCQLHEKTQASILGQEEADLSKHWQIDCSERAFVDLIERYQPTMLRVALRHVSSLESAQDVVGETWLAVLRGLQKFEGRASFKTWLFTILVNRSRTRGKQESRFLSWEALTAMDDDWADSPHLPNLTNTICCTHPGLNASLRFPRPEEQTLRNEVSEWIEQAILALPLPLRRVMVLRDVEGWTAEETCSILGLSEVNQRVLLHRARRKVRAWLEALPIDW